MSKGHCLVVGAGVSGLSSAIRLLENDWKVTIWSSKLSPNTTSDLAAALWYPFLSAPIEKTNVWGSETYDVLKVLSRFPQTGVSMTQTYEYFRERQPDPFWKQFVDEHLARLGMISENDFHLFRVTDDVEEAVEEIVGAV